MVNGYCYDCALLIPSVNNVDNIPNCPHCESEVVEILEDWEAINNLMLFVSGSTQERANRNDASRNLIPGPPEINSNIVHIGQASETAQDVFPGRLGSSNSNTRTISFVTDGRSVISMGNFLSLLRQAGQARTSPTSQDIIDTLTRAARPAREFFEFFQSVDTEAAHTQCTICLGLMVNDEMITQMGCSHTFHLNCLMSWLQQQHTCPVCRAECTPRS